MDQALFYELEMQPGANWTFSAIVEVTFYIGMG